MSVIAGPADIILLMLLGSVLGQALGTVWSYANLRVGRYERVSAAET